MRKLLAKPLTQDKSDIVGDKLQGKRLTIIKKGKHEPSEQFIKYIKLSAMKKGVEVIEIELEDFLDTIEYNLGHFLIMDNIKVYDNFIMSQMKNLLIKKSNYSYDCICCIEKEIAQLDIDNHFRLSDKPKAVSQASVDILKHYYEQEHGKGSLKGKIACINGEGEVGRDIADLLIKEGMTKIITNSKTTHIDLLTLNNYANVIFGCVGRNIMQENDLFFQPCSKWIIDVSGSDFKVMQGIDNTNYCNRVGSLTIAILLERMLEN